MTILQKDAVKGLFGTYPPPLVTLKTK